MPKLSKMVVFDLKWLVTTLLLVMSMANVFAQPAFVSTPDNAGTYNQSYTYAIITSGAAAREILVTNGTLPTGINLTDNGDGTGQLSGTPVQTGSFPIELTVRELADNTQKDVQSFTLNISKAAATITLSGLSQTYSGSPLSVSATTSPVGLPVDITYDGSVTPPTNAGSYTVVATVVDNNYQGSTTQTFVISKAVATVSLSGLNQTYNGSPVSVTANTTPSGLLVDITYDGAATSPTNAGSYAVIATIMDTNYQGGATQTLIISKATPTINWTNPGDITYGTALSAIQLNASSVVSGSFTYTPSIGTVLNAGPNQNLNVDFTPTDLSNYSLVSSTVQINVNKATLTATADDKSRTYGAANPTFTISYAGFVNGDNVSALSAAPTVSTTATSFSNVGTYPINLSGGSATNYNITLVNGTLTITKASLTATADDKSRPYGAANPAFTISYAGFVNGENASVITAPTVSTTATPVSSVATYPITLSGGTATNYSLTLVNGTLTIDKASLTATADDKSRTYGAANPAFTISYAGFVNGENASVITAPTASTSAIATSPVGSYAISLAGGAASNYSITLVNGTLTITKASLTATADDKSRTYGAANPTFTISYAGFVNGDDASAITSPTASTASTAVSSVGAYPINLSGGSATNYSITLVNGTLNITKAALTATADDKSRTYGAANPTFTISYSGFVNGETASVITAPTPSTSAIATSAVGTYAVSLAGGTAANYSITLVNGTLNITKAALTATADDKSRTYGAANPAFTISYSGFVNGENASVITAPTVSTSATTTSPVGSYAISLAGGTAGNYSITLVNGTLTINKAPLTATADDKSRTYGAANPAFTISYSGFVNGETASVITAPTASTSAIATSPVGSYAISLSGGAAGNYSITLVNGTLTITKASLTATADDKSRTYGAANPAFTISYSGFVNGENASVITAPTASTSAVATSPVGSYAISLAGGAASNYSITLVNGTLTITKAALTATADDKSRTYGAANPAFTISYSGFVNGENASVITAPTASTSAIATSPVGSYAISLAGGAAGNYSITRVNGTLTVTKASLIATADDKSRTYGAANPAFTISYSGFVNGENVSAITAPTASTTATPFSAAGVYPISLSGGSATNYNITLVNGSLTVNKATLTATADDKTRLYNTANPVFTITYVGFLNGDNSSAITQPTASTSATVSSNAGSYPILLSGGSATNYTLVLQSGTLVITKVTPTVTWNAPATITYGTPLSSTQLNATASVPGSFSYAPGLGTILNAGVNQALSVNFTPSDGTNYNPVNGTQVLITVIKATPVITWSNPSPITYGTVLSSTQLNASASVGGTFTYTPSVGTLLNAGANQTLSVNFVPTDVSNYNSVSGTTVQITVNKAVPVISWASPTAITFGTALSATQLNASAPVPGTFVYTPSAGTILSAGANQTLSVNFTPTDLSNYDVAAKSVQITVNKATPVITWPTPAAITYGTPLSATQLNATADVPGVFTYTPSSGAIINAGVGQILSVNFVPTDASNYNSIVGFQRSITVNKANPVITWTPPLPIKVGVALSATQLNASASVAGTFNYSPPLGTTFSSPGVQVLSVSFVPSDLVNYNSVNSSQNITISLKDNPVITWSNPSAITYGTALTSTQLNATANVPGTFSYSPGINAVLHAGANQTLSTTFTPTDAVNYNSVIVTTQVTVNKALLTATPSDVSRVYGQLNPSFTINYTGFVNGDNASVIDTPPTANSNAVASSSAGTTFPIVASGGADNDYNFTFVNGTLTINKAVLVARPDDKSRSYGLGNPSFTISFSGFVNGDNASSITLPSASTTATVASNVGTYPITLSGGAASNYSLSFQPGVLTVTPSPLSVRADDKTKSYGQPNPTLTITYSGFLNGDGSSSIQQPSITTTATASSGVGSYPITLSGGSATNYSLILQNGSLTVSKAVLTVTADDKSRVYGQSNPANSMTYSGFVNGDNIASLTGTPTFVGPNATNTSAVGSYSITLTGGAAANYSFNFVAGTLTIIKATITATADNKTQVYGQATPPFTISYSGFVNSETQAAFSSLPVATTTANSTSSVGNYPITVSGGAATNYSFNYVSGNLSITKATLTAVADNQSRAYGAANPPLTVSYVGFANSDSPSSIAVMPTTTTLADLLSPVGSYPINISGGSSTNYNFTYNAGTLTVAKASLMAKADNKTRAYGAANPTLTISLSGFVNGESASVVDAMPTASCSANATSPVGSYLVTVSGGSDNNYNFTYSSGMLSVVPNGPPVVKNFSISTNEDTPFTFSYSTFGSNFSSSPGDSIVEVRITTLPVNGNLTSQNVVLKADDKIKVVKGKLNDLTYNPNKDYFGADNFRWTMSNGFSEASPDAQVSIQVIAVNDPPVLSKIEQSALEYSPADPPKKITETTIISDVDDNFMFSAKVVITDNFTAGDQLTLDAAASSKIAPAFDKSSGVLILKGKDSKANYEKALGYVLFSTPVTTSSLPRKISFVVSDSLSTSNTLTRSINITETLPDLILASAFTPNGDDKNDVWPYTKNDTELLSLKKYTDVSIMVFDKSGLQVFNCQANDCAWDGKANGRELPSGPYLYTIELNGGKRKYQGVVTILR